MKYLIGLGLVLFGLSACSADGSLVRPSQLTPQERCDNAALALVLLESNVDANSEVLGAAKTNYNILCTDS